MSSDVLNGESVSRKDSWRLPMAPSEFHKGVRKALCALMTDALLSLGRMDENEREEVAQSCQRVEELLDFCAACAANEGLFPLASTAASSYERRTQDIARLRALNRSLRDAVEDLRAKAAVDLYRQMSLFIADYVMCMHDHGSACKPLGTNDASAVSHVSLAQSIAPEALTYILRRLVPFMNPVERLAVMVGVRSSAPVQVFDAALEMVRARLSCTEWSKLVKGLKLHEGHEAGQERRERAVAPSLLMLDARIHTAIQAIHASPEQAWSVSSLAALSHLSRAAFTTRFRQQTMRSPMDYLANCRVALAARFIREEKLSLDQVAARVGYSSGAILARAYKRILGKSPRETPGVPRAIGAGFPRLPSNKTQGASLRMWQ
ncbi:helix-turn-helix domain-containing protein [Variovorax sp. KBS0712]|uniref:helix-turn-helix domain-containing protein n=1 Tax=Variovorax sp. KBS0712 TaxID=2578111 RepID=UPI00163D452F|nr:helix-turn-helix domain-containing protein [Variovorax sp. KBS0712]